MEKNCLVTTYKMNVNDPSLLKIGEMRLEIGTLTSPNGYVLNYSNYPVVIKTMDGSNSLTTDKSLLTGFTNKLELTQDSMTFYTNNQNVVIVVPKKYDLTYIVCEYATINLDDLEYSHALRVLGGVNFKGRLESIKGLPLSNMTSVHFEDAQDISSFSGLTNLVNFSVTEGALISGDISSLSGLTNLSNFVLLKSSVSGDISSISGLNGLIQFQLTNTSVSGDISSLSGLTNLSNLNLNKTSVFGDISSLSGLTNLSILQIIHTSVSGDISSISGLTNLSLIQFQSTSLSGDISSLSGLTKLKNINVDSTSISGDISSLGTLIKLEGIGLYNTPNINGEIIDYVISQRSHGRTTGSTWFGQSYTVTFNGKPIIDTAAVSWTASTITNETTSETVNR